jgi:alpha-2-macroglobulin
MKLFLPVAIYVVVMGAALSGTFARAEDTLPRVESFNPTGVVKGVRQVAVIFSDPMIPMGDPRKMAEPFETECPEKGVGRWVDSMHWVYDFDRDLPGGIRCEFRLKQTTQALSGRDLAGARTFIFTTGGPSVKSSFPYEGDSVVEDQAFVLALDGAATEESVQRLVYFQVEGISEPVGVRIIKGSERKEILAVRYNRYDKAQENLLVIQPKQNFPESAKVSLVWARGVTSEKAISTDDDQILNFKVRGPFTANFTCQRESPESGCIPFMPMNLEFSSPVEAESAQRIKLKDASGGTYKQVFPEGDDAEAVHTIRFNGPFPEETEFVLTLPSNLKDEAGRTVSNIQRFPLKVRTESFPPLAKFSGSFGILESKGDPLLPLTLRRIEPEVSAYLMRLKSNPKVRITETSALQEEEKIKGRTYKVDTNNGNDVLYWMSRVDEARRDHSLFKNDIKVLLENFKIPKREKADSTEVVGIPFKEPGFYVVELESPLLGATLLGKKQPMFVPTSVLVTNLAVHFKWGRESSLAWVTALDTGTSVSNAAVSVRNCQGTELWSGRTDSNGIAKIEKLPSRAEVPSCSNYRSLDNGLLVTAKLGDDFSFVHTSWDKGIESWRFNLPTDFYETESSIASTIFARTLLRAGETVNMKHVLRKHVMNGFQFVPKTKWPKAVLIEHLGSNQKYRLPVKWRDNGIAETTWKIPNEAKLGTYQVLLLETPEKEYGISAGEFRVEEFRVPLLKANIIMPTKPLVKAEEATLDVNVSYLSGGGAAKLPVKIRAQVEPKSSLAFDEFEGFDFSSGPVLEGRKKIGGSDEDSSTPKEELDAYRHLSLTLDETGSARGILKGLPKTIRPSELVTELEFNDPNGETQIVSKKIPIWPANRLVGIKPDSWAVSKDDLKTEVALVDLQGRPVPDGEVSVDIYERKTFTHRKRIVGGFYGYEHWEETKKLGTLCQGKTDSRGVFSCRGKSPVSGNIVLQAVGVDGEGAQVSSQREVWVAGEGDWWFEVQDHDRMDLIPAKKHFEPGDLAAFQVRMPFRKGTALVTVEREGVMESFVRELSGKSPIVEIPIRGNYAPNVFISVLAVRGRVGDIQPTALVDLGRPSYRLGVAEINVGWAAHSLKVHVQSEQQVYKVREKATVKIRVQKEDGSAPPKGSEVAIAAVDEGLLELMPNGSWNLLEHMMGRRNYEVQTASAQMFIVGKRHFGLKGIPVGGGGGKNNTRELFDTLLYWKGRVVLNANGEATVKIPLNDSVTSFRIVAIATGGAGFFGTGSNTIRATQDLMVVSGLSPVVRERDRFKAIFTVRNTTDRPMTAELSMSATPHNAAGPKETVSFDAVDSSVAPGEAKEVSWDITVPEDIESIDYAVRAHELNGVASDSIKIKQKVTALFPVTTLQSTLVSVDKDKPQTLPILKPQDALEGRGGIRSILSSSLVGGALKGVKEYMAAYPYSCLEQRVSRAVALGDVKAWGKIIDDLPSYLDSDGLAKYFHLQEYGDPILTSYVLSISDEGGWKIPDEVRGQMLAGLRGFVNGSIRRHSSLQAADMTLRKLTAVEAISRWDADPKLLSSISVQPNLWPTSAVLDWFNVLQRLVDYPEGEQRISEVEKILRARLNLAGTTLTFSTDTTDALWWLMVSNDANAVRLVLSILRRPSWNDDIGRVARGALARQRHGAWDTTLANAWGTLAVKKFSSQFEKGTITGITTLSLDDEKEKVDWEEIKDSDGVKSESIMFPWPVAISDLTADHAGKGAPWLIVQSLAAVPLSKSLFSGYRITKVCTPLLNEQREKAKWSRGDLARVKLQITAQTDMTWVVIDDPIPSGASILGTGLGRDSALSIKDEKNSNFIWPTFQERSFQSMRAYYEFMPKGEWNLEYTVRLNSPGKFQLPPTRIEAMYSPETFGEVPNTAFEVGP